MQKNMQKIRRNVTFLVACLLMVSFASVYLASAAPQGATIVGTPSVDTGPTVAPTSRTDPGGRIITLGLNLEQQNSGWKAYIGNTTGTYVLQNANNFSIYEWPLTTASGEVYISRSAAVNFTTIVCANASHIQAENTALGFSGGDSDSINRTFNATAHATMVVGTTTLLANNCPSTSLWVNDTRQVQSSAAIWQEILLSDGSNLVYASVINNDASGFNNYTHDFQAIIAENRTSPTGTPYYFYLELG
jgi:hypothetical protein